MVKYLLAIAVALAGTIGVAGCSSRAETVGTVGGAAAGGALGSAVTGGSTIGTIGGAAGGGHIGNKKGGENKRKPKQESCCISAKGGPGRPFFFAAPGGF